MNRRYKIIPDLRKVGFICFNPKSIIKRDIKNRRLTYVRFGINSCEVKVGVSTEIEEGEILISIDVIKELKIPLFLSYEIVLGKNNIMIGPYIGMLSEKKEENLRKKVNNLNSYLYSYEEIGGAVLAFSEEGVEMDNQLIRGFLFNPENRSWEEGTYTYPASIFKRTGIRSKLRNHFQSLLGDTVFNNYVFNKWEAHEWLSSFEAVKQYLPDTVLYRTSADVIEFLEQNKSAYIKPVYGSRGMGILKLDSKDEGFTLQYSKNGEKIEQDFSKMNELNSLLISSLKEEKYIVQRTLKLISFEGRTIDFRLILVKGGDGQWHDLELIARKGVKGEITSNVSTGGSAEAAELVFKNLLKLSDVEASNLRSNMGFIGKRAALGLEESGVSCGNLGVDMAIDIEGHIWILEVNNIDPNHTIAIDAKDRQSFYLARLYNMLYAKRLAGFSKDPLKNKN